MSGPLPLVAIAFVVGICAVRGELSLVTVVTAVVVLSVALVWSHLRRRGASMGLVLAALLIGLVRGAEAPAAVPRVASPVDAGLLRGTVVRGCEGIEGEPVRCLVRRDDEALVALSATRCEAVPGDRIEAVATVRVLQPDSNGTRIGPGGALFRRGVAWTAVAEACDRADGHPDPIDRARRAGLVLRRTLDRGLARGFDGVATARARALLFGDERGIDTGQLDAFRQTGLAHLLAVSGAHVALLAALLGGLVRAFARRIPALAVRGHSATVAALVSLPALTVFVLATGESASAMRSLIAAVLAALVRVSGRRPDAASLVAASAVVSLAIQPAMALDAGWQLSLSAAWALSLRSHEAPSDTAAPSLVRSLLHLASEGLVASVRVALVTAPVLAWHFLRVPATALVANALAAPLAEAVLLPAVLCTGLLGAVHPWLARHVAFVVAPVLDALFALPLIAQKLPWAAFAVLPPTPWQAALFVTAATATLLARRARHRVALVTAALVVAAPIEIVHRAFARPHGVLRVTALDVGQGDAILVDLPDGTAMLVDSGGAVGEGPDPGARVVVPMLADRRRRALVAVVASHPHPDHVGGLSAVLDWARVDELWDTRQGEALHAPAIAWSAMRAHATARGVPVRGPESLCGPPQPFHGAVLEVLAPCPSVEPGDAPNDGSFVLRLSLGQGSVVLAGDVESRGEARIVPRIVGTTTVLKVAHHGSRTSSTEPFLDALRPRVALISAGHPSPFGHPHDVVLDRLHARGTQVFDTPRFGAIAVTVRADGGFATAWGAALDPF